MQNENMAKLSNLSGEFLQMNAKCYRPHLHSFARIHPKDLTVLPYFHFANYNYEMWMEVPTMYYAQESNPTLLEIDKKKIRPQALATK